MNKLPLFLLTLNLIWFSGCAVAPVEQSKTPALQNISQLHIAVARADLKRVTSLLDGGTHVDEWSNTYGTPLIHASSLGQLEMVKLLLQRGANIDIRSQNGWTPLGQAAMNNKMDVAQYLVDKDADIQNAIEGIKQRPGALDRRRNTLAPANTQAIEKLEKLQKEKQIKVLEERVNQFIAHNDLQGLKEFTDKNPNAVYYIQDLTLRLALTGPEGLKVGDIAKLTEKGKSDVLIISLIKRVKTPYKEFTLDEIDTLSAMGINDTLIAAMVDVTTELLKDKQRKLEQEYFLKEQAKIARESQKTQVIQQVSPQPKQRDVVDVITEEAAKQGMKMLLEKLF
jgi:ribosomal 30S subunit maturation factor RimM